MSMDKIAQVIRNHGQMCLVCPDHVKAVETYPNPDGTTRSEITEIRTLQEAKRWLGY